jgi:uncharacterized membrane protein
MASQYVANCGGFCSFLKGAPMEEHLHTWLSMLIRWAHVVAAVAWIGASFYFNWLENRLRRLGQPGDIAEDLWAVHGGGFYFLRKLAIAPEELPAQLNWFKWTAYATWITGVLMLILVYYWQADTFLVDAGVAEIETQFAVAIGLGTLVLSWAFYDLLCRSQLSRNDLLLGVLIFGWFALVTWALSHLLNGHAAYLHVGAAAGTIMVANVFHMIVPAQKDLVKAVVSGHDPDALQGARSLQRSRHNSYFALPVIFIMTSGHYPLAYQHELNWLVLLMLALIAVAMRHFFNMLGNPGNRARLLVPAAVLLGALMYLTAPRPEPAPVITVESIANIDLVREIIERRCQQCHSAMPQFAGFTSSPLGIEFDRREQVIEYAERIHYMTVIAKTMPKDGATKMSDEERQIVAAWFAKLQRVLKVMEQSEEPSESGT